MKDLYLGIDLGGSGLRSAIFDRRGVLIQKLHDVYFKIEPDNEALLSYLGYVLIEASQICPSDSQIVAWGLASPGPLDPFKGIIETPPNLKVRNLSVVKNLESIYPNLRVFILNDADAALLAEFRYGAARGLNHVVGVFAGTGLGTSFISNGRIQRGRGKGGGWSHTSMHGFGQKRECVCGRVNCIEAFVGTLGLAQTYCQVFKLDYKSLTREDIFGISVKVHEALIRRSSDYETYRAIISTYVIHLLEGLKNIICVHNPECIILGGGIIKNNPYLIRVLSKRIKLINDDTKPLFENLVIKSPELDNPGILGAAAYAMDGYDRERLGILR